MSIDRYISKLEKYELLTQVQVRNLTRVAIDLMMLQPNVLELSGEQYVIGDIHGQFHDILHLFNTSKISFNQVPKMGLKNYVFLGDYVDRGYNSIQTICYLLAYKCKFPQNMVLLRGNHQTASLTKIYGFYDEVIKKYGNQNVWKMIIEAFQFLPLAAVIAQQILCIHGGLSPQLPFVSDISILNRIVDIPQAGPMCDLLWSDPQKDITNWVISNRGAGYFFSHDITKQFLYLNGLKTIARAHQLVQEGYTYNFGDESLVTVWSAPNYCYRCGNQASVLHFTPGKQRQFIKFYSSPQTNNRKVHYDHVLPYFL